jgi:hypothetical protein
MTAQIEFFLTAEEEAVLLAYLTKPPVVAVAVAVVISSAPFARIDVDRRPAFEEPMKSPIQVYRRGERQNGTEISRMR